MKRDYMAERELINAIQAAESKAHRLGLTLSAQALNRAKNVAGWEMAGEHSAAVHAMSGDRP